MVEAMPPVLLYGLFKVHSKLSNRAVTIIQQSCMSSYHMVGLGSISILPFERNTMMCNTERGSYFENAEILCEHYYCTFQETN